MKLAESVTFGGASLDRAAHLRGNAAAMEAAIAEGGAEAILMWRGKPLTQAGDLAPLVRLPRDHPVLETSRRVFLGREAPGRPLIFAHDISHWEPEGQAADTLNSFLDPSEQCHPDLPGTCVFAELRRIMTLLSPRDAELAATARALFGWHDSHGFCACCGAGSAMDMGGWRRRCPVCAAPHFPRTDPVVIMLITQGNSALLGRSPGWPDGMYSLLAGFVEPGETVEAAVRREVQEETAVAVGEVTYLASQPWPFPASLMIGCRGTALSRDITIDRDELEDAIWVSREDVMDAFAGRHRFLAPARRGAIAQFLLSNWLADRLD
ncbi:NAD(+) diphosphatase [Pelagivirga sediminicola]|uniref:NAD(+) diphosphatase n=1 Tax=Pelagivirga sediminicola TaxID=2170575 RepID=A0A2T7GAD8_9RHOB|nr:NAD(+) diphosphatase [Pelagivirga sediminicola]PVA11384.1 NAD(+) diphosphatase [Pelagivirga sediminicola]